jgi:hypothetical protein
MREEQNALFPRLVQYASPEDLRRLGEQVESAINSAPTRSELTTELTTSARPRQDPGLVHRIREQVPRESGHRTWPRRPRTPSDPDADQSSMWPDLWAGHRCW